MALHFVYKELPPSSNKIYFRGTILTKVAREYAERFAHFMIVNHGHQLSALNPAGIYEITLHFYFDTLVNESWNNQNLKPSKRAKSRYKRLDLSNRVKLLEDCVRDAIAIDDCQTFEMHTLKKMDPSNPRVEIFVNEVSPDWYGIPKETP